MLKGNKRGADDSRKYFLRIVLKDNRKIEALDTWSFKKIKRKYQIILAMVKGMIITKVNESFVKNESIYTDYIYKEN